MGAVPLSAGAIEQAIALNGVAVEQNTAAFRAGRRLALAELEHPEAATTAVTPVSEPRPAGVRIPPPIDCHPVIGPLVRRRAADLTAYQDRRYGQVYVDLVARAFDAEQRVVPGRQRLTEAVARRAYQLMAYKDEYEVARLHLDQLARGAYGDRTRVKWLLQPPVLRSLGLKRKIAVGAWFRPAFVALHSARRLRHTPLDPFARTRMRTEERRLVKQYRSDIDLITERLSHDSWETACLLAELPEMVRGYEGVKEASISAYEQRRAQILEELSVSPKVTI